jgi:hypothetical protein
VVLGHTDKIGNGGAPITPLADVLRAVHGKSRSFSMMEWMGWRVSGCLPLHAIVAVAATKPTAIPMRPINITCRKGQMRANKRSVALSFVDKANLLLRVLEH